MITFQDCLGLCDCDRDEIRAIAEHEHLPEIVALELSEYLVHLPKGAPIIRQMILDDIDVALEMGEVRRAHKLQLALQHFSDSHPDEKPTGKLTIATQH